MYFRILCEGNWITVKIHTRLIFVNENISPILRYYTSYNPSWIISPNLNKKIQSVKETVPQSNLHRLSYSIHKYVLLKINKYKNSYTPVYVYEGNCSTVENPHMLNT